MTHLWQTYLFAPLLNALIFLYDTISLDNLGIAVIWLTIVIRILLLPLSVIVEKIKMRTSEVSEEIPELKKAYRNDYVALKEAIRELLRQKRVNPWANILLLGIQLLVLVILYQVFIHGMRVDQFAPFLYSWVKAPTVIDTTFIGWFDTATRNVYFSGLIGFILFWRIWQDQRTRRNLLSGSDILYRYLFPVSTFFVLWYLPSVKTLFIFTSMLFSVAVHVIQRYAIRVIRSVKPSAKESAPELTLRSHGDPWAPLRVKK